MCELAQPVCWPPYLQVSSGGGEEEGARVSLSETEREQAVAVQGYVIIEFPRHATYPQQHPLFRQIGQVGSCSRVITPRTSQITLPLQHEKIHI